MAGRLFTSESVTEGHPDKIADQISDTDPGLPLEHDPTSRVAVETLLTTGLVVVAGEVTTSGVRPDRAAGAPEGSSRSATTRPRRASTATPVACMVAIGAQSADIAQGVDDAFEERVDGSGDELDRQGAGDQGLMFGYACDDTPSCSRCRSRSRRRLAEKLTEVRKDGTLPYLRPDGKTQVTIEYDEDDRPVRDRRRRALDPARRRTSTRTSWPRTSRSTSSSRSSSSSRIGAVGRLQALRQPDRPFRHRRPDGRRRADRSQDHRRHLRRHGPPRWRRVLRQGPVEGRPVCAPTPCAGSPRTSSPRASPAARGPGRLRDRQGAPGRCVRRDASAPGSSPTSRSRPPCSRCSTSVRPRSCATSTCCRPIYAKTAAYGHFGRELPEFTWERTDRAEALKAAAGV